MAYIAESRSSYNSENKHVHFSDYGGCSMACDDPRFSSLMEENMKRRKALRIFLIAGAVLSSYYAICLIIFKVKPEILNCHINYGGALFLRS